MLRLVTDNNTTANYTSIADAFARFAADTRTFARFVVLNLVDPYDIRDSVDGDTPDEKLQRAIDMTEQMLECPKGIEDIAALIDEVHELYKED